MRNYILPAWGERKLRDVTHEDIQTWVSELGADGLSGSSVQRICGILSQVLDVAVRGKRLPSNPAHGARLPRKRTRDRHHLTADQVEALAAACEPYGLVVRFLAYTGLRWGEMAALQVGDLDLLRRRIHVRRSVTENNGALVFDKTKTGPAPSCGRCHCPSFLPMSSQPAA